MRALRKSDRNCPPPAWCLRPCLHEGVCLTGLHLLFLPQILQKHLSLLQLTLSSFLKFFLLKVLPSWSSCYERGKSLMSHRTFSLLSLQPCRSDVWFLLHLLPLAHLLQRGPVSQTPPARGQHLPSFLTFQNLMGKNWPVPKQEPWVLVLVLPTY